MNRLNPNKPDRFILDKKFMVILFILGGIVFMLISGILSSKSVPEIWVSLSAAFGGSLFAIGLVDFIVSFSTVKEYIKTVVESMYDIEYLEKLDTRKLEKLRDDATIVILRKNFENNADDQFLLEMNRNTLKDIVSNYYIDDYEIEVYFNYDDTKTYVHKKIITRAKYIKTIQGAVAIRPIRSKNMIDIPSKEIYAIKECSVNKNNYIVQNTLVKINSGVYNVRLDNDFEYIIAENESIACVEHTVEMLLPSDDHKTTFVLSCLCKKMRVDYYFLPRDEQKVRIDGNAFCADATNKVNRRFPNENHFQIEIDGSVLRGEGVVLYYQPME